MQGRVCVRNLTAPPALGRIVAETPSVFDSAMVTHLEAGDVLLWDDRTIHCNSPGRRPVLPPIAGSTTELQRIAFHVCMSPIVRFSCGARIHAGWLCAAV